MKKIMLVEDSKNITLSVKICLEEEGYQVITAEDGIMALETVFQEIPDLILLDLLIPKMSGLLVLKAIRENPTTHDIPVMIVSAKSQEVDIQSAYKAGANDYLVKPFTPSILLSHIRRVLTEGDVGNEDTGR